MHICIPICPILWVKIYYVQIGMLPALLYGMNRIRRIYTALIAYLLTYSCALPAYSDYIEKSVHSHFLPQLLTLGLTFYVWAYKYILYTLHNLPNAKIGPNLVCQVPKPGDFTWRDDNPTNKNPAKQLENSWYIIY